jgi:hypothetical protein
MIGRLILKAIGVLTLVSIGIVGLAVILLVGWFLMDMGFPNRMSFRGRVTDGAGRPIKTLQVSVLPLPIFDAHSDDSTKPARGKEQIVVTDQHGRFRLKKLFASGRVKQGLCLQQYDIGINAEAYSPALIHVRNDCDRHMEVITLLDVVLKEEKTPYSG